MSDLPLGWVQVSISELAYAESGIGFPLQYQGEKSGDIGFFKVGDISRAVNEFGGHLLEAQHYVSYSVASELRGKPVPPGATVFAKIGEAIRLNRRAFVATDCLVDNNVMAVKAYDSISDRYLYRFMQAQDLSVLARSTTVPSLRKGDIEGLQVPVAPLNEQKRIADKLDGLLARVDACRDRLDRVPVILKRFRQSVLAAATSGKLTEVWRSQSKIGKEEQAILLGEDEIIVPGSWSIVDLKDVIDPDRPLCYGVVQPGEERSGGVPLIRVQDMNGGGVLTNELRTVSSDVDAEYKRSRVVGGDLLVSVVGTIGRTAIVPQGLEANIARAIARIACRHGVNSKWVNYWFSSDALQWWLTSSSKEVARKTLNLSDIALAKVAIPSGDEQTEIVRRVESLFAYADRLEARYAAARAQTERLTPALLAKAFRGELVPQDPNDEPASELLKRIQTGRSSAVAGKPRRGRKAAA